MIIKSKKKETEILVIKVTVDDDDDDDDQDVVGIEQLCEINFVSLRRRRRFL